jgi:hypothetical protein
MTVPMRATIIPSDQFCSVDGVGFIGVDMTSVGPEVHAVQWYGTHGEVEVQNPSTGKMVRNEDISNLDAFQSVLDSYWDIRAAVDAAEQEAAAENSVIEV